MGTLDYLKYLQSPYSAYFRCSVDISVQNYMIVRKNEYLPVCLTSFQRNIRNASSAVFKSSLLIFIPPLFTMWDSVLGAWQVINCWKIE